MLARKNVMVDPAKVKQLAKRLGTSESEAIRRAVETLLLEEEVMGAAERIRRRRTLKDVYGRVSPSRA